MNDIEDEVPEDDDATRLVAQDDETLLRQIQADPTQFGVLFDRYYDEIFGYLLKRSGNFAVAQDLASQTFESALRSVQRFRWRGVALKSWLYRIASNELASYFRASQRFPESLDRAVDLFGADPVSALPDGLSEALAAERDRAHRQDIVLVWQALQVLPVKYQEVIVLRYLQGLKVTEIAEILGKREGTVKSLLSRGVARLRIELGQESRSRDDSQQAEKLKQKTQPSTAATVVVTSQSQAMRTGE